MKSSSQLSITRRGLYVPLLLAQLLLTSLLGFVYLWLIEGETMGSSLIFALALLVGNGFIVFVFFAFDRR